MYHHGWRVLYDAVHVTCVRVRVRETLSEGGKVCCVCVDEWKQTRKVAKDGRKPSVKISVGSQSSSRIRPFAYPSISAQIATPYLVSVRSVSVCVIWWLC